MLCVSVVAGHPVVAGGHCDAQCSAAMSVTHVRECKDARMCCAQSIHRLTAWAMRNTCIQGWSVSVVAPASVAPLVSLQSRCSKVSFRFMQEW
jgi:hypothetical protein